MTDTRRDFLKLLGGGVFVAVAAETAPDDIAAWLHIGADGVVRACTGKAEMGQNIRTSLTQAVAEELGLAPQSIVMVMGDTDLTPYDAGTFGSRTTPYMAPQLRRAAAAAREALLDLAAERWGVDRSLLSAGDGRVTRSDTRLTIGYGELAQGRQLTRRIPADIALSPASAWKTAGSSLKKVNGRDMVTGRHRFAPDLKLPGALCGKVVRPPAWNSTIIAAHLFKAQALPGVVAVQEGNFIGVAAPSEELAEQAAGLVTAEWKTPPQPAAAEIFDYLKKNSSPAATTELQGAVTLARTYTVAYIAHAPLEPRAAVAEWKGDRLTVWTGSQRPFGIRAELAAAFRIPEQRVRVIIPDTGSGYGGKHQGDAAVEAARLSKVAGRPVKLVWTREEEFAWAYFRPAGVIDVAAALDAGGALSAWHFHNCNSGAAGIRSPYHVPNRVEEYHASRSPLRQGSYRALAATANHFARETAMDELAHAARLDPLEFRLRNARDPRLRAVLQAAAAKFGWAGRSKTSAAAGFGIACGFEKGGYVATCAAIEMAGASVKVRRVVEAFECGAVVNPDHLENQVTGMVMMGLGGALWEAVDFANGRILNGRFSRYRVPRFADAPPVEVVLVDRKDLPSAGGGETPICGIAPAVGNAIFDATGARLRSLPLQLPRA